MGNNVAEGLKPEERELGEHAALIGNRSGKHDVKSGKAVGGYEKQIVSQLVEVANFASGDQFESGKIGFPNYSAHIRRCHE
jgi:hypothetical protein